jgi:ABC-type multidrug transport system fused ATPase/permease subunit
MSVAAYDRARKLWSPRKTSVLWARLLGVLHSLLVLKALLIGGLLASLVASRGEVWRPTGAGADPRVVNTAPLATRADGQVLVGNSGILPLIVTGESSRNALHRTAAAILNFYYRLVPTLRNNRGALTTLMASSLGVFFVLSIVAQLRRTVIAQASLEAASTLRRQIHRQLYRLGQSSLPSEGTGPVLNLFTREVNDIREGLAADLADRSRIPVLVVGLILVALTISWPTTLFLATLGGLTWAVVRQLNRSAELASVVATRESAVQLCLLQEDFGLIRTVRVHGMENFDKQRFDEHLDRHREAEIRRVVNQARTSPTANLLICAAATLALGLLASRVILQGSSAASALLLVVSLLALVRPSLDWLAMNRAIRQANRSAEGVFAYLERKPELHQAGGARFLAPLRDRISFENVTLENGSGRVLLDGLTVEIPAGTRTSIMSLDEEAKSALVCLIPRLIDPKVGRVRVDGVDLREVTLESVRSQVATVLQADLVFSDTVLANIALGDASYDLPRVIEAAKVAHAHNFIQDLPHGYDTVIGPLGAYLKPDQQYRIALARAFLHDPSIVIIEEPDATLDDDTKAYVDDTLARLAPGRTLIMLPHRLSTIRTSDQVILIHNGKLEASGTPTEVKAAKLFRHLQYVEFNQFAAGEIEAGQMSV